MGMSVSLRVVPSSTHHRHLPALGDGSAAAAHAGLVPARPVHLLPGRLLPPVEEGLIHQEAAPQRGPQELGASWGEMGVWVGGGNLGQKLGELGARSGLVSPPPASWNLGEQDWREVRSSRCGLTRVLVLVLLALGLSRAKSCACRKEIFLFLTSNYIGGAFSPHMASWVPGSLYPKFQFMP